MDGEHRQVVALLGIAHKLVHLLGDGLQQLLGHQTAVGGEYLLYAADAELLVTVVLGLTAMSISLTSVVQTRFFGEAVLVWPTALRLFVQIVLGFAPVALMLGMASTMLL